MFVMVQNPPGVSGHILPLRRTRKEKLGEGAGKR